MADSGADARKRRRAVQKAVSGTYREALKQKQSYAVARGQSARVGQLVEAQQKRAAAK